MEGLVLGSEDAGSINPFIVALISQPQSISLLETGYGSEVIGWKSAKSINTTRRALCVVRKTQNPDQVLYTERQQNRQLLRDKLQWESRAVRVSVRVSFFVLFCFVLGFFYVKINKSVILQSLVSVFKGTAGPPVWSTGGRSDVLYISTMDRPPPLLSPPLPLRVALCGSREGIRKSHTRRLRAKPHFSRITIK